MNKQVEQWKDYIVDSLKELQGMIKNKKQLEKLGDLDGYIYNLCTVYEELLQKKAEQEEDSRQREEFLGLYRWLAGQAKEMSGHAAKRPETKCRSFKADLMNKTLMRLRDILEADAAVSLPLVSEQEEHSYSDVSLLLRSYMDLCANYAERHYRMRFDFQGREVPGKYGYGHRF